MLIKTHKGYFCLNFLWLIYVLPYLIGGFYARYAKSVGKRKEAGRA